MKNLIILLFCSVLGTALTAQDFQVQEMPKKMSQGVNNALVFTLENINEGVAQDIFEDFMKKNKAKIRKARETKNLFADNAKIEAISNNTIDIYANFEQDKQSNDVTISLWFNLGGAYLSSDLDQRQFSEAINMIREYRLTLEEEMSKEDFKLQRQVMKALEKDLKKLEKENESYKDDIKKAEELIAELRLKIEQNLKEQAAKKEAIQTQDRTLERAKAETKKN